MANAGVAPAASDHRVVVLRRGGYRGADVPVLDELAVAHSKDVDGDIAVRAGQTGPMGVDGDDVAVGDDAAYLALGARKGRQERVDVIAQTLEAIFGSGSVLDIDVADVAGDRAIDVTVEMRLLVEGGDDLLLPLSGWDREWSSCQADLSSAARKVSASA